MFYFKVCESGVICSKMKINAIIHKNRRAVSETEILMNSDFFEKKSKFIKISVSETTSLPQSDRLYEIS
jgi:hypothetical protein